MTKKEYDDFIALVKRMREAQNRVDMLADGEDIEFVDMLCIEQREAEREVDEYLKNLENIDQRKALEAENTEFDYGHNVKHYNED